MSYDTYSALPNNYFVKATSAYDNERELYEVLQMEGYNNYGVDLTYYPVSGSTSADRVFGEDVNQVIVRRFDLKGHYELPAENKIFSLYGMLGVDLVFIWVNKLHLEYTSTFSSSGTSGTHSPYSPLIGDILRAHYNGKFYEVMMVKEEDEMFLQGKHSWLLVVKEMRDKQYIVSNELISLSDVIVSNVSQPDILSVSAAIETEKQSILYTQRPSEISPKETLEGWD